MKRLLDVRLGYVTVGVAATLVTLPSLAAGLYDDDLWQRRFLLDHLRGPHTTGWWQLFGVPLHGAVPALVYGGYLPWWTSQHFQLSFFRPLATLTHYLDYAFWPQSAWLMHLQSTAWYVALCVAVAALYRRTLGAGAAATLAALIYAIDEGHLEAVGWLAARNSVLTALLCTATLLLLDAQRRTGARAYGVFAACTLALSHLSSEGAIAVWAYVAGRELCVRRPSLRSALIDLAPCALVSAAFTLLTRSLNYTVVGSGAYIDPAGRPLEFTRAVLERLPQLLSEQFGPPAWLNRVFAGSQFEGVYVVVCVCAWLLIFIYAVRKFVHDAELGALCIGAIGSALVVCTARPEPRLLLMVGIGADALLAKLLVSLASVLSNRIGMQRVAAAAAVCWIAVLHIALAPIGSFTVPESYRQKHRARVEAALGMDLAPVDPRQVVAILQAPSYFDALSIATYRLEIAPPAWRALHILGTSEHPVVLRRPAPDSLELVPEQGYLVERTSQQARSPDEPFSVGQTTPLDGLNVVVEEVNSSGRPSRVRLEFAPGFPDHVRLLTWNAQRQTFDHLALPAVGAERTL